MITNYTHYKWETPFPFSQRSSIGCGGYSVLAIYPETAFQTSEAVAFLREKHRHFYVVGNMTNVLPPDGETQTVILSTKGLKDVMRAKDGLSVGAGVTSGELLSACKRFGLGGAEFLEGIPCTIGGALYMNAGVSGEYVERLVESVTVLREGKILTLKSAECNYSYKQSVFMQNEDIILSAVLRLSPSRLADIEERISDYRSRRAHLPKGKSMGCVFKNPEGKTAGALIEGAGLKGLRIGGAVVSNLHANFILNDGGATAKEVKELIQTVKNAVYAQYKVLLQEEIRYLI